MALMRCISCIALKISPRDVSISATVTRARHAFFSAKPFDTQRGDSNAADALAETNTCSVIVDRPARVQQVVDPFKCRANADHVLTVAEPNDVLLLDGLFIHAPALT